MASESVKLVTGANGFIGSALCRRMLDKGWKVRGAVRSLENVSEIPERVEIVRVGPISIDTFWKDALSGVDTVIHLAGMTHIMNTCTADLLSDFRGVNAAGTKHLAREAALAGVRRFIYISSIGVNGEFTNGNLFTEDDMPQPASAYAVSKWEAEQALHEISKDTGLEVVILRPPLVYGPGAPGNFSRLMRIIKSGLPLPLGNVKGLRSFIYVGNLADALCECADNPLAPGNTFLVSDGEDLSVSEFITMIALLLGRKPFFLPFSLFGLRALSKITGKGRDIDKLTRPLAIDSSKIRRVLNWKPPFTLEDGLAETVAYYKKP